MSEQVTTDKTLSDDQIKLVQDAATKARKAIVEEVVKESINSTCDDIISELGDLKKGTPLDSQKLAFQRAIALVKRFRHD